MKRMVSFITVFIIIATLIGCTGGANPPSSSPEPGGELPNQGISLEEQKRIDLYIAVMKAAYKEENGGSKFIAVKLDTLEGLSEEGKAAVLQELTSLSSEVYDFEEVKKDKTKFALDENGNLQRTLDGSLLFVENIEYKENKASITGVSWFGNLGAVFPSYEAVYKDGKWELKLVSMAVS